MSEIFTQMAAASRQWPGDAPSGAMLATTRAFLSAASKDYSLLREAAASLSAQDPGAAAWIAVALGNLVEQGASPELSGPAVLDHLKTLLAMLAMPANGESTVLSVQFRYFCQSVVTHLARLPARRQAMSEDAELLDQLDVLAVHSLGASWVHEALLKSSDTLVLLHPTSGTGLRLWYANVSNNFHLFSLLQVAVGTRIPGGHQPNDAVAQVARGRSLERITDSAWWHYGDAYSPKADATASIRGEWPVSAIPRVDGAQVMLLWPPILASRTWAATFMSPHLEAMPADAGVERILTADESQAWLKKLGIGRRRKWWWF